jgi:hypothetical protein
VPDDVQRDFLGQTFTGKSGATQPTAIQAAPVAPMTGAAPAPGFRM